MIRKIIHIPLPAKINRGTQNTQRDTALAVSLDTHHVVSRENLTQTHGHTGRPPQQRIFRKRNISRDPGAELVTPGYVTYKSGPGKKKGFTKNGKTSSVTQLKHPPLSKTWLTHYNAVLTEENINMHQKLRTKQVTLNLN